MNTFETKSLNSFNEPLFLFKYQSQCLYFTASPTGRSLQPLLLFFLASPPGEFRPVSPHKYDLE